MKPADRAAGDDDEGEGKQLAGEDRAGPVDESRESRKLQWGQSDENAHGQKENRPDLHEGREIVPGESSIHTGSTLAMKP